MPCHVLCTAAVRRRRMFYTRPGIRKKTHTHTQQQHRQRFPPSPSLPASECISLFIDIPRRRHPEPSSSGRGSDSSTNERETEKKSGRLARVVWRSWLVMLCLLSLSQSRKHGEIPSVLGGLSSFETSTRRRAAKTERTNRRIGSSGLVHTAACCCRRAPS